MECVVSEFEIRGAAEFLSAPAVSTTGFLEIHFLLCPLKIFEVVACVPLPIGVTLFKNKNHSMKLLINKNYSEKLFTVLYRNQWGVLSDGVWLSHSSLIITCFSRI